MLGFQELPLYHRLATTGLLLLQLQHVQVAVARVQALAEGLGGGGGGGDAATRARPSWVAALAAVNAQAAAVGLPAPASSYFIDFNRATGGHVTPDSVLHMARGLAGTMYHNARVTKALMVTARAMVGFAR